MRCKCVCPTNKEGYERYTHNKTVFNKAIGGPAEWLVAIGTKLGGQMILYLVPIPILL